MYSTNNLQFKKRRKCRFNEMCRLDFGLVFFNYVDMDVKEHAVLPHTDKHQHPSLK